MRVKRKELRIKLNKDIDVADDFNLETSMMATEIIDLVSRNLDVVKLDPIEGEILQFGVRLNAESFMNVHKEVKGKLQLCLSKK